MTNDLLPDACPLCGGKVKHHTDTAFHHGDRGYKPKSEDFIRQAATREEAVRGL